MAPRDVTLSTRLSDVRSSAGGTTCTGVSARLVRTVQQSLRVEGIDASEQTVRAAAESVLRIR